MDTDPHDNAFLNKVFSAQLSPSQFKKLSEFIYTEYGIKMPPEKKIMLQSRLQKRLRALKIASYKEYIDYLFSKEGMKNELFHMIDMVSTNKTDFFREPTHFDILTKEILPTLIQKGIVKGAVKVWSAGCSSGEEPYTIAIVMNEFCRLNTNCNFSILGSDISIRMLQHAATAVYDAEKVEVIPYDLKKKYLLKSKDAVNKTVRIAPFLRNKISFKRINFMSSTYNIMEKQDIIFCRNVLIYFDRETQERVIGNLCNNLKIGGYFFLGHSESIMNMNLPLKQIKPTVFMRI